jgi:cytochrome c-type biogenesis protein
MTLLFASFVAGILTILAPCILPVLPVIIGGSSATGRSSYIKPIIIVGSLGASIFLFTLLLKASTTLLGIPQSVWQFLSASILVALGLTFIFPRIWETISLTSKSSLRSQQLLAGATNTSGIMRPILTGAALGPVFTSCSPTYLFIVAAVLPSQFWIGISYLVAYIVGLCLALGAVAIAGNRLTARLKWGLNPNGWFRKSIGILLVATGFLILVGGDKALQTYVIDNGWYAPIESAENALRN